MSGGIKKGDLIVVLLDFEVHELRQLRSSTQPPRQPEKHGSPEPEANHYPGTSAPCQRSGEDHRAAHDGEQCRDTKQVAREGLDPRGPAYCQ